MTDYSRLIEAGRLKPGSFSRRQVEEQLRLARRDLTTARKLLPDECDWAFNIAYNAMLQAGRALMLREGFRPASEGQHVTVISFLRLALGGEAGGSLDLMDRMRRKRHVSVYDQAGTISSAEAEQALENAERFVRLIEERTKP